MMGFELFLAYHLLTQPVSSQQPITCPVQKSARVDVRWRSEPIKYDYSKSHEDLANNDIDSENPYGTQVATDVGGLMSGKVEYQSGIEISAIRYPASQVTCLWIDKVVIDIVIDPTVQVASEHPKGSCEYLAIIEHEHKHVATDRQVVTDHLEAIRRATGAAVQKVGVVGPKPQDSAGKFKEKMSDYVQDSLKEAMDAMYADRIKRQRALDTRDEYDRVKAQCDEG